MISVILKSILTVTLASNTCRLDPNRRGAKESPAPKSVLRSWPLSWPRWENLPTCVKPQEKKQRRLRGHGWSSQLWVLRVSQKPGDNQARQNVSQAGEGSFMSSRSARCLLTTWHRKVKDANVLASNCAIFSSLLSGFGSLGRGEGWICCSFIILQPKSTDWSSPFPDFHLFPPR